MSMYNAHRGMMPQHVPPAGRLADLLDQIRVEFENQSSAPREYEQHREQLCKCAFVHLALTVANDTFP